MTSPVLGGRACFARISLALVCLTTFQIMGCITVSGEGVSTGQMKRKVTESQFYRHAAILYPKQNVNNTEAIPPLDTDAIRSLEGDLEDILKLILRMHQDHRDVLTAYFGASATESPEATVLVTNLDLPQAQTTSSGEIAIDARVVQSMLRAALVTAYEVEIQLHRVETGAKFSRPEFSPEEEAIAINTFLSKRARFDQTPDRSVIGDLMDDDPLRFSDGGSLSWLEMSNLLGEFNDIAVRYDTQLRFLVAHEVGHLVLGHFGSEPVGITDKQNDPDDDCGSAQRSLERAADVYATILLTWATPQNALDDFLGLFGGATVGQGLETFFGYAYDYAGFKIADGGEVCASYPPPSQRAAAVRLMYDSIREQQIDSIVRGIERSG